MGLFSSKKKIYVSSSSYNLAGDFDKRQDFLKTIIFSHLFSSTNRTYADSITQSYLNGPGIRFRNFEKWADSSGYEDELGTVASTISVGNSIDAAVVLANLPIGIGETGIVEFAEIDGADMDYWADQYMLDNHPDLFETEYAYDVDEETNEVIINFEGGGFETFIPSDYDVGSRYLYVYYFVSGESESGDIETGAVIVLDAGDPFPDTTDWTGVSYTSRLETMSLDTTVEEDITYSDATPPEYTSDTTTSSEDYTEIHGQWTRTTYQGLAPEGDAVWSLKEDMYHDQIGTIVPIVTVDVVEEDIGGGVIKTTTTTTTTETLVLDRTYRIDEQEIIDKTWSKTKVFIYKLGSGNEDLDDLFQAEESKGRFFPYIPLRLDNRFISNTFLPDTYAISKKATKKAIQGSYDEVIENLADNSAIGDIDYAYIVFGVSLNTRDNACKKYLFTFFDKVLEDASVDPNGAYSTWLVQYNAAVASAEAWTEWKNAQEDPLDPLFNTPEPTILRQPLFPINRVHVRSTNNSVMNYDMEIRWSNLIKTTGTGLLKLGAKRGEVWLDTEATPTDLALLFPSLQVGGLFGSFFQQRNITTINYQVTENTWEKITLRDLTHINKIYRGKAVQISADSALADEEESGFILPLHVGVWRSMRLVDTTQMATQCSHLVLNSYQVVKTKWYQRGAFKIVIIIVLVVVAILFPPVAGLNAAIGTSLGLTGTAAIIVGAAVTVLAGVVLSEIVLRIAVAIFGEKIGTIVATVVMIAVGGYQAALRNGGQVSLAAITASLAKAENLLKLTMAIGNGISQYVAAGTADMMRQTQSIMEQYEVKSKEILEAYKQLIPEGSLYFDPMMLTDSARVSDDTPDSFLSRTLLTGSEIAEMSLALINNYADYTLSTSLR